MLDQIYAEHATTGICDGFFYWCRTLFVFEKLPNQKEDENGMERNCAVDKHIYVFFCKVSCLYQPVIGDQHGCDHRYNSQTARNKEHLAGNFYKPGSEIIPDYRVKNDQAAYFCGSKT